MDAETPRCRSLLDLYGPDNWHVAQLKPNALARAQQNLVRQGFATLSPFRWTTVRRGGHLVDTREPLFPGYLLVRFDPDRVRWHVINATRGVARLLIEDPRRPHALSPAFCAPLFERCAPSGAFIGEETFQPGERVRVMHGPFAGAVSRIEALTPDGRVRLLLEILGRQTRTELAPETLARVRQAY